MHKYGDKSFFGLCFGNDSKSGYEVRNPKKNLKVLLEKIKPSQLLMKKKNNNLVIFEGYIDFLAYLTYSNTDKIRGYINYFKWCFVNFTVINRKIEKVGVTLKFINF